MEQRDNQQGLQNFQMRKETFLELCAWLAPPPLRNRTPTCGPASPLEKQVTIAVWKLATLVSYQSVGNQFGMGKSVGALIIQVGEGQHTPAAKGHPPRRRGPHRRWLCCHGLPQPDGVIDSTHILIWAPNHWASLCINEQDLLLHVLQALINHHGQLTHDLLGGQGRRTMPTCSAIAAHFTRWGLGLSSLSVPSGSGTWTCHCALWGDVACAGRLDPSKERCNARLSRACVQVEGAFRCLKAHF
nr:uncharacterized protein LOC112544427 [Pelodiscus sinensis]|eukprot:XP_025036333.1 uncharacterized protein LOC112544427 [Pelodiscus sinensis]